MCPAHTFLMRPDACVFDGERLEIVPFMRLRCAFASVMNATRHRPELGWTGSTAQCGLEKMKNSMRRTYPAITDGNLLCWVIHQACSACREPGRLVQVERNLCMKLQMEEEAWKKANLALIFALRRSFRKGKHG